MEKIKIYTRKEAIEELRLHRETLDSIGYGAPLVAAVYGSGRRSGKLGFCQDASFQLHSSRYGRSTTVLTHDLGLVMNPKGPEKRPKKDFNDYRYVFYIDTHAPTNIPTEDDRTKTNEMINHYTGRDANAHIAVTFRYDETMLEKLAEYFDIIVLN